jgi:hypothetical protein
VSDRHTILEAAVELDQLARDFKSSNAAIDDGRWLDDGDREYHDGLVDLVQRLRAIAERMSP